jgi:hypothetical protein
MFVHLELKKSLAHFWVFTCWTDEPSLANVTENLRMRRIKSFLCLYIKVYCEMCVVSVREWQRRGKSFLKTSLFAGRSWINRQMVHTEAWIIRRGLIGNSWKNWWLWINYNAEKNGVTMFVALNCCSSMHVSVSFKQYTWFFVHNS